MRPEKKIETQTGYKPMTSVIPLQRYRFKSRRGLNFFQTLFQLRSSVLFIAVSIDSIFVYKNSSDEHFDNHNSPNSPWLTHHFPLYAILN